MRRELPPRPNLEHFKKQAKDLLDAHQRQDPAALARIRDALPSFAKMTDDDVARAPFALHDAQSALAREHGLPSWNALREAVAERSAEPPSSELLRALMPLHFPASVGAALRDAWTRRAAARAEPTEAPPLPGALPLLGLRDALLVPRALAPIHIGRLSTRAAVEAALARTPSTIAVFSQRAAETEQVDVGSLHPVGCEATLHARIPDEERAWVILEGTRWIVLDAIEQSPEGYPVARVSPFRVEPGDPAEVSALAQSLAAGARTLASKLPQADRLLALLDPLTPEVLGDLVMANLPLPVEPKARYASEPRLVERLRIAGALVDAQLAARP